MVSPTKMKSRVWVPSPSMNGASPARTRFTVRGITAAKEPASRDDYRRRHDLPSPSHVQRAAGELVKEEVVGREPTGSLRIVEPFFAEWVSREQADYGVAGELQARKASGE